MNHPNEHKRIDRRLAYYTVAAGAGVLSGAASADPVDANINIILTAQEGEFVEQDFDIDGDGSDDFTLQVRLDSTDGYGGYCGDVVLFSSSPAGWTAYAQPITPGTQVDDSFEYTNYDWLYEGCPFSDPGVFDLNERGFIGFRIPADVPAGDQGTEPVQYGYMDVEILGGSLTAIIRNVRYESTPDTPITVPRGPVGDVRSVPVGGAVPLGLLLFAAGAAALRRRNRSEA